ncbi:HAD family hydrolase [Citrobacter sp. U14242]|uniref:HAD family hydrolase n=1 Tax=Citrobacter sp. U14242 TaxID=3390192 RepID=UPI00397BBE2E
MSGAKQNIAAVLFDMDGVLIDSNSVIERAWSEAAQMYGRTISTADIVNHIHGQPGPHTLRALFSDLSLSDREKVQQYIIDAENNAEYQPIAGISALIAALAQAGITIGIVTSGWRYKINRVIDLLDAHGAISVIVERDDVERGKPWPDPYLLAIQRLKIPAETALVFEDSASGVTSAVRAGTFCVGIGGKSLLSYGAKYAIADFSDVHFFPSDEGRPVLEMFPGNCVQFDCIASR